MKPFTFSQERTPLQEAAFDRLLVNSSQTKEAITPRRQLLHAINVCIALELRKQVPVTEDAVVESVCSVFGYQSIDRSVLTTELAYLCGELAGYPLRHPQIERDRHGRITNLLKHKSSLTQEILDFLDGASICDSAGESALQVELQKLQPLSRAVLEEELEHRFNRAHEVGRNGEVFIDHYFAHLKRLGKVDSYRWISIDFAKSPFDFWLSLHSEHYKIEVKTTTGNFEQPMYISVNELQEMRDSEQRCEIYRIYKLDGNRGHLRIANNLAKFAEHILDTLSDLPNGVNTESVSVQPESIDFDAEITFEIPEASDLLSQ